MNAFTGTTGHKQLKLCLWMPACEQTMTPSRVNCVLLLPLPLPPHIATVTVCPCCQVLKVFIESGEELLQELRQAEEAYTQ